MRPQNFIVPLILGYCLLAVFAHLDDHALEIFDEGRRAVSSLEMSRGQSHWLVPTYAGEPDHWGTKPPLLIWCQAFWTWLLGPGELAVRLPSALATVGIFGLFTWWGKKDWGSCLTGALASLVLVCNLRFMGNHGARSGDFDALLALFLFGQVIFFYRYARDRKIIYIGLAALSVLLAGLTKGVAGGFLLPGIGLWILLDRGRRKLLARPLLWILPALAIAAVVGYYFLREAVDPGYLQLVADNELGGRYQEVNEGHHAPWYFYLESLFADPGFGVFFCLLGPAAVYFYKTRFAGAALLCLLAAASALLVVSTSATKLYWYQTPALPPIAMLVGAFLYHLARLTSDKIGGQKGGFVAALLLAALFVRPIGVVLHKVFNPREYRTAYALHYAAFRDFMRRPEVAPPYTVLTESYNPHVRYYVEKLRGDLGAGAQVPGELREQGGGVSLKNSQSIFPPYVVTKRPRADLTTGERVVVCSTPTWEHVYNRFTLEVIHDGGKCKLVLLGERR